MGEPRLREIPRRGWALVADTFAQAFGAVAVGSGVAFVALAIFGFLAEEGFRESFLAFDLDPLLRVGVGVTALVIAGALGLFATFLSLARLATVEQLARDAEATPDRVPAFTTRRVADLKDPFSGIVIFAIFFLVLDAIAVLLFALTIGEGLRYDADDLAEPIAILVACLALGAGTVLLLVVRRRVWKPRWAAATKRAHTVWKRHLPAAVAAERQRRRTDAQRAGRDPAPAPLLERALARLGRVGMRVGGSVLGIAIAVSLVTLFMRQPCRRCDHVDYADAGEAFLDVLARVSTVALVASLALLILAAVAGWAARAYTVARLAAHAADPTRAIPETKALRPAFTRRWPTNELALAAIAVGGGGLPLALTAASRAPGAPVVELFAALAIGGVVLLAVSEHGAARARNRMREAWSVGDLRPAKEPPTAGGDAAEVMGA